MEPFIDEHLMLVGLPDAITDFLAAAENRYCVALPGRDSAVQALADAVSTNPGAPQLLHPGTVYAATIERMLGAGSIRLEEEHKPGGAYWVFTPARQEK